MSLIFTNKWASYCTWKIIVFRDSVPCAMTMRQILHPAKWDFDSEAWCPPRTRAAYKCLLKLVIAPIRGREAVARASKKIYAQFHLNDMQKCLLAISLLSEEERPHFFSWDTTCKNLTIRCVKWCFKRCLTHGLIWNCYMLLISFLKILYSA